MVQRGDGRFREFWSDGPAMFMMAFSFIVIVAASQVGGLVGAVGMLIAGANIVFFVWETLLKDVILLRR